MSNFDEAINTLNNPGTSLSQPVVSDYQLASLAYAYGSLAKFAEEESCSQQANVLRSMSYHFSDCLDLWIDMYQEDAEEDPELFEDTISLKYYSAGRHEYERKRLDPLTYLEYISANAKGQVSGNFKLPSIEKCKEYCWKVIDEFYSMKRG